MPPSGRKRKKIAVMPVRSRGRRAGACSESVLAPPDLGENLGIRQILQPQPRLEIRVRRPEERVRRPLQVQPRRHRRHALLRASPRSPPPVSSAPHSPRRPTARTGRCSPRTRARNRPASRPAAPPSGSGSPTSAPASPRTAARSPSPSGCPPRRAPPPPRSSRRHARPYAPARRGPRPRSRPSATVSPGATAMSSRGSRARSAAAPTTFAVAAQRVHRLDVVGVVVGDQDEVEPPAPLAQRRLDRPRLRRVHEPHLPARRVAQQIGVVVAETRDGDDLERHGFLRGRGHSLDRIARRPLRATPRAGARCGLEDTRSDPADLAPAHVVPETPSG